MNRRRPRALAPAVASLVALLGLGLPQGADAARLGGVAAASRGAAVLVWSEDRVLRSDDGEHFAPVDVGAGEIWGLAVGVDGSFAVLLGGGDDAALGLHRRGRPALRLAASELGGELPRKIDAGAGEVALLFEDRLERRAWDGRLIAAIELPHPCEDCDPALGAGDLDLAADGTLRLTDTEINTCTSADVLEWQRLVRVAPRGSRAETREIRLTPADYAATWQIGARGWLYGISYARRLLAVGGGGPQAVEGVAAAEGWQELLVADNGRVTIAAIGAEIWRLDGARGRLLARAPAPPSALAVDARTRPLVVIEGDDGDQLLRFERARGWVRVALPE